MLDAKFPPYTPGSRRLYEYELAGEQPQLLAEVRRTLDSLATSSPARVAKGSLTEDQAKATMFLWLSIANDLEAAQAWHAEFRSLPSGCDLPNWSVAERIKARGDGFTWKQKVEALRGAIEHRRTSQESDVGKGRLTADQAKEQLERLEAVHDLYWLQGFAFDGTRNELIELAATLMDAAIEMTGAATAKQLGGGIAA
jgi:hypothetical protein